MVHMQRAKNKIEMKWTKKSEDGAIETRMPQTQNI